MQQNHPNKNSIVMELHPYEAELVRRIREKYRYGEITVKILGGLPDKIVKEVHFDSVRLSTEEKV